jgi:hypothetical protein
MCFDFPYNFCRKIFSFEEKLSEIWSKLYMDFLWSTGYSCQILIKLEFSVQVSEKYSDINFMKLRSVGAEFCAVLYS